MAKKITAISPDNILVSWVVPEYEKHERTRAWYITASVVTTLILAYALWTANFLFVVIIVLAAVVVLIHDSGEPEKIIFAITDEGVVIGGKLIDFNELKNFSIIYKPRQGVKQIYFEFHNVLRPRLSVGLDNMNPLPIRDILLNYLQEDLERENQPLSEQLGKLFKI